MPREISWYLDELKKHKTPGNSLTNLYDRMYRSLQNLEAAIGEDILHDDVRFRQINELYAQVIQQAEAYLTERQNSFWGPSDWEVRDGLLGSMIRDLTAQQQVMRDMSDPEEARRQQYGEFRSTQEEAALGPQEVLPAKEAARLAEQRKKAYNQLKHAERELKTNIRRQKEAAADMTARLNEAEGEILPVPEEQKEAWREQKRQAEEKQRKLEEDLRTVQDAYGKIPGASTRNESFRFTPISGNRMDDYFAEA